MNQNPRYTHVSCEWVRAQLETSADLVVLDVRTLGEFVSYHIPQALLHPIDVLSSTCDQFGRNSRIILICEHGIRSEMAARWLAGQGFSDVSTMDGGMAEYEGEVIYGE